MIFVGERVALAIGIGNYKLNEDMVEVERASIEGQRGRDIMLSKMNYDDFVTYHADLRGIPTMFAYNEGKIYLYPCPDRDMTMLVEGTPSDKAKVKYRTMQPPDNIDRRTKEWREYKERMDAKSL